MTQGTSLADLELVSVCRACGQAGLMDVLTLGATPLANSLAPLDSSTSAVETFPLDLVRCTRCSLVQLRQIVSPSRLFAEYVYFSSFSDTMLDHSAQLADEVIESERLGSESLVVEIASNDGYLLQFFQRRGVPVLGIEPARNIARVAEAERGIPTIPRFFTAGLADELVAQGRRADVVIGNNVLAHVPDLNGFVRGVEQLLGPGGAAFFEVPYLKNMLDDVEYDTIYHEHQCYFSLTALAELFARNGLTLSDASRLPIHGGSLRVTVCRPETRTPSPRVQELLDAEADWGVATARPYARFAQAVQESKRALVDLLSSIKARGERIAAYGAAAKGVTLLSYCGLGGEFLDFVVDRSTFKQGKRFPVDRLPIYEPRALCERKPDYTLLLTWNFASEILRQRADYLALGGKFISPVPVARVLAA